MAENSLDITPKISGKLEKYEEGEDTPFEIIYIEDEKVVKIERRGVDY